jgi:hypothetical protein
MVLAGPSCRAVVPAGQDPAASVPDVAAVVVPTVRRALQRIAHPCGAHAEVVETIPSSGTGIPAVQRVAAAIADGPTVLVSRGCHAGVCLTDGGAAFADMVRAARPPGQWARSPAVERAAAAVPDHSTIRPAGNGASRETNGSCGHANVVFALLAGGTGATMLGLPTTVPNIPAVLGGSRAAGKRRTKTTIRVAQLRQHQDGGSVRR